MRAVTEVVLIGTLYVLYCASRTLADGALGPARAHAADVLHVETLAGIAWEASLNHWFVVSHLLALAGSYWYATMHYLVTAVVLVWLWTQGPATYRPARTALIVATLLALVAYLLLPTAPPRLVGGYVDVLSLTSGDGWWGADASAPKGLGGLTNELAAFPSLHAGWALWVAVVLRHHTRSRVLWALGAAYALTTALVIVGTGNHWILDAVVGWLVVGAGFVLVRVAGRAAAQASLASRLNARRTS
ncbi:MAG: phosphatase PAP2 family protein [Marmoricola sp.]